MDLRSYVNGKEYKDKMVQGIVVSEEYNETLDSATVILSQIPKINDLRPYDDFFIYEGEFKGYDKEGIQYAKIETSERLNGFHFSISQKYYDNESADIFFYLKIEKNKNVPNFYIDFNPDDNINKATYFAEYNEATEDFPPSITFKRINGSEKFPEIFNIGQRTETEFDGSFEAFDTIWSLSNMKLVDNNEYVTFDYTINSKYSSDFNGYYDLNQIASSQYIKIPESAKTTDINIDVIIKKVYFKKEKTEISDGIFDDVDVIKNVEFVSYSGKLVKVHNLRYDLYVNKIDENLIISFFAIDGINFGSTYGYKQEFNDEKYDYCFNSVYEISGYVEKQKEKIEYKNFYKHFLVDQYTEEMLNIDEDPNKILYKYKIELFSETKKLETIQIPNFSVTQPQHGGKKKNIYSYIVDVVDMYSPVYKVILDKNEKCWIYRKKYSVDESLKGIFENLYCPDFTLNNPNLRDVLAQLMLVADMIPYVEDDIIKAMDITQRKGNFDWNKGEITNIVASRTSSNHCDNLKRTYSDALSQNNSAHSVELIGFRNSSSAMLTLENLKLETRFPIYKINKMYLCYYKKAKIISQNLWSSDATYNIGDKVTYGGNMYESKIDNNISSDFNSANWTDITKTKIFLCKQDITKLILLEQERNLISQDWTDLVDSSINIDKVEKMAQYKFFTLGYNIGSNEINGFGTKYEYFNNPYWNETATYIQNVLVNMDKMYPLGIYNQGYFSEFLEKDEVLENTLGILSTIVHPFETTSVALKSLFFQVDYNAFYNGTIYHSKDTDRDDVVINDNSSSSLTLLEQDGIHQKEKANRFGNKTIQISSRYKDITDLQPLGSVFEYADENDIIIYHRQYSIFDNIISCSYSGSKDYVLKNYFTSVYAKHRPYNLMSYGESVRRSENRKMYVNLSENNAYIENENKKYSITDFESGSFIEKILSFFKPEKKYYSTGEILKPDKINNGYIVYKDKEGNSQVFSSDINTFSSGDSLCFNLSMYDNVSAGLYLDKNQLEPDMWLDTVVGVLKGKDPDDIKNIVFSKEKNDYVRGTKQQWYLTVDDPEEGHTRELGFFVGHKENDEYLNTLYDDENQVVNIIKDELFALPLNKKDQKITNKIGDFYVLNKDNKEIIDMTFQVELISDKKDQKLFYNNLLLQLSDLNGVHNKFEKNYTGTDFPSFFEKDEIFAFSNFVSVGGNNFNPAVFDSFYYAPVIILSIKDRDKDEDVLGRGTSLKGFEFDNSQQDYRSSTLKSTHIKSYKIILNSVKDKYIGDDGAEYIEVYARQKIIERRNGIKDIYHDDNIVMVFKKTDNFGFTQKPAGTTWYSNCEIIYHNDPLDVRTYSINFVNDAKIVCKDATFDISDVRCYSVMLNATVTAFSKYSTVHGVFNESNNNSEIVYRKNLYLATSQTPLDKMSVYKQFIYTGDEEKIGEDIFIDNSRTPEDVISVEKAENGVEQLVITIPQEYIDNNVQSIQVWYLDNDDQRYVQNDVFYFVFGINLTPEDKANGYVKFNVSVLSTRDLRVFDESHKIIGKVKNVANSSEIETEQKYEEQQ